MKQVDFIELGLIDYKEAWDYQTKLFEEIIQQKILNRAMPNAPPTETRSKLIFCEHPHVYTLGKSGSEDNLLLDDTELLTYKAAFYKINRGGDITYHGPGQIVAYPIFDLDHFFTDIHRYLRYLEEAVINTLARFNISAGRIDGLTGVWVDHENQGKARKICAMGVKCSRWVTMHGIALNVNTNLDFFENIIPCGISDKAVTSMNQELGHDLNIDEVKAVLKSKMEAQFKIKLLDAAKKTV